MRPVRTCGKSVAPLPLIIADVATVLLAALDETELFAARAQHVIGFRGMDGGFGAPS